MDEIDKQDLTLLASIAYGESYYKENNFEEMSAIASVMLRQMKCRGYQNLRDFIRKEKSFSYVVSDGKQRFTSLKNTNEADVHAGFEAATKKLQELDNKISLKESESGVASGSDKKGVAELKLLKAKHKGYELQLREAEGRDMAYRAARHALSGGQDFSNGAYFWDGWDIKTGYEKHAKVKKGIRFSDPSHNIFGIDESTVLKIKYKKIKETKAGKVTETKKEEWRYDHVYESTAAHGGTVFWKFNPDYVKFEHSKDYL